MPLTMFAPNNAAWTAFEAMLNAKDPRLTTLANQLNGLVREGVVNAAAPASRPRPPSGHVIKDEVRAWEGRKLQQGTQHATRCARGPRQAGEMTGGAGG